MKQMLPTRTKHFVVLGLGALTLLLVLTGCKEGLGRLEPSNRVADAEPAGAKQRTTADNTPLENGERRRFCSLFLLNATPEVPDDVKDPEKKGDLIDGSWEKRLPMTVRKYKQLHDEIPAEALRAMAEHHLRNYSVHIAQVKGEFYVVRYYEYAGTDYPLDMNILVRDPAFRKWREACEACEIAMLPVSDALMGATLEEIFHKDLGSPAVKTTSTDKSSP